MDVVVERVCQVVAEEAPIPGVAQRVVLAEGKVVARVKEQGEKDSFNAARVRAQKRGRGFEPPTPWYITGSNVLEVKECRLPTVLCMYLPIYLCRQPRGA